MFNAQQFLRDYHVQFDLAGSNSSSGWVNISCPLCDDHSTHGGFNLRHGYYNCWRCGKHDLEKVISKIAGVSYGKAKSIASDYMIDRVMVKILNRKKARAESLSLPGSAPGKFHRRYLEKRNFDPDKIIYDYKILGTGPAEKWESLDYSLRIIIPIFHRRKVISFQGRDITGKQKERYKGCPIEKSIENYKNIVYNIDNVEKDRVVVVEGIADVWRMGPGFVASFGTTMTHAQIRLLSRFKEIFFLFDPEPDAQAHARKYAEMLAALGRKTEVIRLDAADDPGDLNEEQARLIRRWLL